jgi:TM2 domain-containing membrane protein YozV
MQEISPKSRLTLILLNIFLGVFGIHRLYLGKTSSGYAMLALGTTGFSIMGTAYGTRFYPLDLEAPMVSMIAIFIAMGIWSLVDFIITISGKMKDKEGRPVKK